MIPCKPPAAAAAAAAALAAAGASTGGAAGAGAAAQAQARQAQPRFLRLQRLAQLCSGGFVPYEGGMGVVAAHRRPERRPVALERACGCGQGVPAASCQASVECTPTLTRACMHAQQSLHADAPAACGGSAPGAARPGGDCARCCSAGCAAGGCAACWCAACRGSALAAAGAGGGAAEAAATNCCVDASAEPGAPPTSGCACCPC